MWRPEVVNNLLIFSILEHPEHGELTGGDLDRLDEVDPVDNLHAAGSGEGARVGAVGHAVTQGYGGNTSYEVTYLTSGEVMEECCMKVCFYDKP